MKKRTVMILAAVTGLTLAAAFAVAQTAPFRRGPPSPETIQRWQDGKIAMAVSVLKMTPEQLTLWAPVEAQIRAGQAARLRAMQARFEARRAGRDAPRPELPDRLERLSATLAERSERMKAFVAAYRPFHATLSDEQKAVAEPLLAEMSRERWMRRGNWVGMRGSDGVAPQPTPQ